MSDEIKDAMASEIGDMLNLGADDAEIISEEDVTVIEDEGADDADEQEDDAGTVDEADADDSDSDDSDADNEDSEADGIDEDESSDDGKDAKITELESQIKTMSESIDKLTKALGKDEGEESVPDPSESLEWESQSFVEDDFDVDTLTKDGLNKMLNTVAENASRTTYDKALAEMTKQMPLIIKNNIQQQLAINSAVTRFYTQNKDLIPHKATVSAVGTEISAKHPEMDVDELFEKAGKEARKRLNLVDKAATKKSGKKKKSGLTDVGSQVVTPASGLKGLDAEIGDILAVANK